MTSNMLWRGNTCKNVCFFSQLSLRAIDSSIRVKSSSFLNKQKWQSYSLWAVDSLCFFRSYRTHTFSLETALPGESTVRVSGVPAECTVKAMTIRLLDVVGDFLIDVIWSVFWGVYLMLLTSLLQFEIIWVIVVYFHLGLSPRNLSLH